MDISIIVPTHDRPKLLRRAVASALAQKYPPKEVIVVNDGSGKVDGFDDPRVRILSTSGSRGTSVARNLALANLDPESKAVCYLDDDDELLPNHLALLSQPIADGAGFAFSKAIFKYLDGFETEDPEPNNHGKKRYYDPKALLIQNIAPVSSFIHAREAAEEIGGFDETLLRMEDWDFWARMFLRYGPPVFVNSVTNVIYKGLGENRTDCNQFAYSLSCSWRDIVDDRLKHLCHEYRCKINADDLKKFHVPKVAVVMPVYNAEPYLRAAMDSILEQTFSDFEIIAIDDHSTDHSKWILNEFSFRDRRVRLFENPANLGVAKTLNQGLLFSRSQYVARMDADDLMLPDRFRAQVDFLDNNRDIMILGTYFWSMDERMKNVIWDNRDIPTSPDDIMIALKERCCLGHPTIMMRRRVVEAIGGYAEGEDFKAVEDYDLWMRASRHFKIANLPQYLLKHRTYEGQVSRISEHVQRINAEKIRIKYG